LFLLFQFNTDYGWGSSTQEASFLRELKGHRNIIEMLKVEKTNTGNQLVLKYMPGEFSHKLSHSAASFTLQVLNLLSKALMSQIYKHNYTDTRLMVCMHNILIN